MSADPPAATLQQVVDASRDVAATLTLRAVDERLTAVGAERGAGANGRRRALLPGGA